MSRKTKDVREAPSIELYMYSLNQEFPVGKGHETYLKRFSELQHDIGGALVERNQLEEQAFRTLDPDGLTSVPSDWSAQWISNRWITNHTKAAGVGRRPDLDPLRTAIMRREDFGAIVFEPRSDRVYKLNEAGAELFERLQKLHREGDGTIALTDKTREGFGTAEVEGFVAQLKAVGLLSPHAS
ncbi:PqqD family protein [Salinarimonas sp. NSM]|uniref:PqqD family protein n=1 Tax=Salinarimonas sp. NSM TaxID=3458003 RepID=UPI0040356831